MKYILILLTLIGFDLHSQTIIDRDTISKSKLVIKHPDMVLYLQSDTNTMVSDQTLTYKNYSIVMDKNKSVDRKN